MSSVSESLWWGSTGQRLDVLLRTLNSRFTRLDVRYGTPWLVHWAVVCDQNKHWWIGLQDWWNMKLEKRNREKSVNVLQKTSFCIRPRRTMNCFLQKKNLMWQFGVLKLFKLIYCQNLVLWNCIFVDVSVTVSSLSVLSFPFLQTRTFQWISTIRKDVMWKLSWGHSVRFADKKRDDEN